MMTPVQFDSLTNLNAIRFAECSLQLSCLSVVSILLNGFRRSCVNSGHIMILQNLFEFSIVTSHNDVASAGCL